MTPTPDPPWIRGRKDAEAGRVPQSDEFGYMDGWTSFRRFSTPWAVHLERRKPYLR